MNVCVYCASSDAIDASYLELAGELGAALAKQGYTVVSGGGRVGAMGALARAARSAGAHTVGVIPEHLVPREVADVEADELLIVNTMRERKRIMDERAHAFVVLPGGIGTMEEMFEVWTAGSLGMHDKPVIILDPDGFYAPLWDYLEALVDRGFVKQAAIDMLHRVTSVDDAIGVLAVQA